mgnify:CR=1 FL=1
MLLEPAPRLMELELIEPSLVLERWRDDALFRPEVRLAYGSLLSQGWIDSVRTLHPDERVPVSQAQFFARGLRRYGFHGLSYAALVRVLRGRGCGVLNEVAERLVDSRELDTGAPLLQLRSDLRRDRLRAGGGLAGRVLLLVVRHHQVRAVDLLRIAPRDSVGDVLMARYEVTRSHVDDLHAGGHQAADQRGREARARRLVRRADVFHVPVGNHLRTVRIDRGHYDADDFVEHTLRFWFTRAKEYDREWADYRAAVRTNPNAIMPRRDLRLDFFRGLALWFIFIDHVPSSSIGNLTFRNFGFSDATEIFVFCSGIASALAFGRVFDRAGLALGIIEDAERRGLLQPGQTVVEATSGNTGIGLAMVCAAKGYPLVVTMAEQFSVERRRLMRFLGAKVVKGIPLDDIAGYINETALFRNQWQYRPEKGEDDAAFKERIRPVLRAELAPISPYSLCLASLMMVWSMEVTRRARTSTTRTRHRWGWLSWGWPRV